MPQLSEPALEVTGGSTATTILCMFARSPRVAMSALVAPSAASRGGWLEWVWPTLVFGDALLDVLGSMRFWSIQLRRQRPCRRSSTISPSSSWRPIGGAAVALLHIGDRRQAQGFDGVVGGAGAAGDEFVRSLPSRLLEKARDGLGVVVTQICGQSPRRMVNCKIVPGAFSACAISTSSSHQAVSNCGPRNAFWIHRHRTFARWCRWAR